MKKTNFLALALFMGMFATQTVSCGNNEADEKTEGNASEVVGDTSKVENNAKGFAASTNIRYVDMERVIAEYTYAQQEQKKIDQKAVELQNYQNSLAANLQKRANEIQQKAQSNGYLTQESYEKDMKEFNSLDQNSGQQYAKREQAVAQEVAKIQQNVYNAINNYIIKYNEAKKYDAILYKSAGVFFNPSLDITNEIIAGLNGSVQSSTAASTTTTEPGTATK